jgi:hypothetical protein
MSAEHSHAFSIAPHGKQRALARQIAAGLLTAAAFASSSDASAPHASSPASVHVGNCNDAGAGSLRDAIAAAGSGDVIDLTTLSCSTISLSTGQIVITQSSLAVIGPGSDALAIDGGGAHRVFTHVGAGTLQIEGLSVRNGYALTGSGGGCIRTGGDTLLLNDTTVTACKIVAAPCSAARGGAVYARHDAIVLHSTISNGDAEGVDCATGNFGAQGGGLYVGGSLSLIDSTISGNRAAATFIALGGGVWLQGSGTFSDARITGNSARYGGGAFLTSGVQCTGCSVDSNTAVLNGGGMMTLAAATLDHSNVTRNVVNDPSTGGHGGGVLAFAALLVRDSRFAYNSGALGAAVYTAHDLTLERSTIAYNYRGNAVYSNSGSATTMIIDSTIAGNRPLDASFVSSAITVKGTAGIINSTIAFNTMNAGAALISIGPALDMHSSIVAGNDASGAESDVITAGVPISGEHNLIRDTSALTPADTLSICPKLDRLAMNGGPTPTMMLLQGSAGIDAGSNVLTLTLDQRGSGFVRSFGATPDIGAFERQGETDDALFSSAFEAHCDGHMR